MRLEPAILAAGLLLAALPAWPHDTSVDECIEGSDFIRNAALSRDNGIARGEFIDRMHADIDLIQAFPKELRWFVQDESDAALLLGHAALVFDEPRTPESHQAAFLQACIGRTDSAALPAQDAGQEALLPAALHRAAGH
jgi:hypothetical protein